MTDTSSTTAPIFDTPAPSSDPAIRLDTGWPKPELPKRLTSADVRGKLLSPVVGEPHPEYGRKQVFELTREVREADSRNEQIVWQTVYHLRSKGTNIQMEDKGAGTVVYFVDPDNPTQEPGQKPAARAKKARKTNKAKAKQQPVETAPVEKAGPPSFLPALGDTLLVTGLGLNPKTGVYSLVLVDADRPTAGSKTVLVEVVVDPS